MPDWLVGYQWVNALYPNYVSNSRSEAVRDILRTHLQTSREQRDTKGSCVANLSYVYKHHERELSERLIGIRIRYSPLALSVLMECGTQIFVLVGKLTTAEAAETFLKWREKIAATVASERGPFIAKIRRDGVHS